MNRTTTDTRAGANDGNTRRARKATNHLQCWCRGVAWGLSDRRGVDGGGLFGPLVDVALTGTRAQWRVSSDAVEGFITSRTMATG